MKLLQCKTIVSKTKNDSWFGTEYNMNIYRGCCHGCIYCDSRSDCYRDTDFDTVKVKEDALAVIENDLSKIRRSGVVATGGMSDPYNPFERGLKLTSGALALLDKYRFGAAIATKSPEVAGDAGILQSISGKSPVIVKMTVTTADDGLCAELERNVAPSSERFNAISALAKNGIYCGILLMPVLPFINDNEKNILDIVHAAKDSGAKFIYPYFGVTLRSNQRDYFFECLDRGFPGLKEKYIKLFGDSYSCFSPDAGRLFNIFSSECEKLDLKYKMQDIVNGYKNKYNFQLSFFNF